MGYIYDSQSRYSKVSDMILAIESLDKRSQPFSDVCRRGSLFRREQENTKETGGTNRRRGVVNAGSEDFGALR